MMLLAAIAGVSAATAIYSIENVVDRKITTKIQTNRAAKAAAAAEADIFCEECKPVQPAAAPAQQPTPSAREAELELQLAQMQAVLTQLQAAQAAPAAAPAPAQPEIPTVQAEVLPESAFKVGQKVALSDAAQLIEGSLADTDVRVGVVRKINTDGTVRVGLNLGGKKGVRMVTLSEYDLCPAE